MSRYGRPLGLGIALGVSTTAGCSGSSETKDALPGGVDAYGIRIGDAPPVLKDASDAGARDLPADTRDALSPTYDIYVRPLDTGHVDVYGIAGFRDGPAPSDRPVDNLDTRDALSPNDVYVRPLDGGPVDVYGVAGFRDGAVVSDSPVDTRDAPSPVDAGDDAKPGDAD
jgi:hypothetical protein